MADELRFEPQGFILARSPALPFERFLAWSRAVGDAGALRAAWKDVGEAIYFSSPSAWQMLRDALAAGRSDERTEDTVARYVSRAATRTTPFGRFASISAGTLGARTALRFDGMRVVTALDFGWAATSPAAQNDDEDATLCTTNPTLQPTESQLQFIECTEAGTEVSYALSAIANEPLVTELCELAVRGCAFGELAAHASRAAGVEIDAAREFVRSLVAYGVLLAPRWPSLIGNHFRTDRLRLLDETHAPLDSYRALEQELRGSLPLSDSGSVFHTILVRSGEPIILGANVVREVSRAVTLLAQIGQGRDDRLLAAFAHAFAERYGDREVPLLDALDEERGIGFDEATLLGAHVPPPREDAPARQAALLELIDRATRAGVTEVELTPEDVAALRTNATLPLPPTFNVLVTLAASSEEAVNAGDFTLHTAAIVGPPATRLMSRFWYALPELEQHIADDIRREEASDPDAVFAELVYQPAKALEGNLLLRPRVRRHEILISGSPSDGAELISLRDLVVRVSGDSVTLRSRHGGRVVHPRVSSAHNFARPDVLAIHRFLGSIQWHAVRTGVAWNWRALAEAPFVPRVRAGRIVLSLAHWNVRGGDLRALQGSTDAARSAVARLHDHGVPSLVVADGLTIDLESKRSLRALQRIARRSTSLRLQEYFPAPNAIPARNGEGRLVTEMDVPFCSLAVREKRLAHPVATGRAAFPPGSDWLYAKLYARGDGADAILLAAVEPTVAQTLAEGWITTWFFVRYVDPLPHLRVRFRGEPSFLLAKVLPLLTRNLEPFMDSGRCARLTLDTYEPELARYGGVEGMACSERLFAADSEAVLRLIASGECGTEEGRRAMAILGIDRLLRTFGLSIAERRNTAESLAGAFTSGMTKKELAQRFRAERHALWELLRGGGSEEVASALDDRCRALAPIVRELEDLERGGVLGRPVRQILSSYCHMFVNRLVQKDAPQTEAVAYDFLARLCTMEIATGGGA